MKELKDYISEELAKEACRQNQQFAQAMRWVDMNQMRNQAQQVYGREQIPEVITLRAAVRQLRDQLEVAMMAQRGK